jgi:bleomycin hydrolase
MKTYRFILTVSTALVFVFASPQNNRADDKTEKETESEFDFTVVMQLDACSVKHQASTSTCWSFATNSFLESELLRMGKGNFDLSEMFIVRHIYPQKALNYVQLHGNSTFGPGSLSGDLMRTLAEHGAVPESVYDGKFIGQSRHNHQEMDAVLTAMLDAIIANKGKRLSPAWREALEGVLDAYIGPIPESFEYQGKTYTPSSFLLSLGIEPTDYVELTSFTHHPFDSTFALEIPDNWAHNQYRNVSLEELMAALDSALEKGYTVAWDGDVSEKGFDKKEGIAILPRLDWDDKTEDEQDDTCKKMEPEKEVTQELRQEYFENYATTDDHLMHIVGIASDQNGTKYYITKNSSGIKDRGHDGHVYMSEAYVRAKTIAILLHRNALPKNLSSPLASQ